jgi:hypothetical protein
MPVWLLLVLLGLTTYRATRLVVRDDFPPILWAREKIQQVRPTRIIGHGDEAHYSYWWGGELVSCHWCASGWISLALVGLTDLFTSVPAPLLMWGATWAIGAWINDRESEK